MFDTPATYWFTAAPSIAAFLAAFAEGGVPELRRFCARVFRLRFPVWLWAAAVLLPLAAALLTFASHPADLTRGGSPHVARLLGVASLMSFLTGPIAEEFGWRGYLLGRLAARYRPLAAGLIIAPVWAAWHVPLFYDSVFADAKSTLLYLTWLTAWSVVLSLIVAKARGSVLPSVLGHWAVNSAPLVFFALLPALPGEKQPGGVAFPLASAAVACAAAWFWRDVRWIDRRGASP